MKHFYFTIQTIQKYQANHDYSYRLIDFDELQEAAIEWQERQREMEEADKF